MPTESEGTEWTQCVEQAILCPLWIQDVYLCHIPTKREAYARAGSHRRQHHCTPDKETLLLSEDHSFKERNTTVFRVKAGAVQVARKSSKGV